MTIRNTRNKKVNPGTVAMRASSGRGPLEEVTLPKLVARLKPYLTTSPAQSGSGGAGSGGNSAVQPSQITLPDTQILVGNASGKAAAVALSGDATIDDTGAATVEGLQTVPVATTSPSDGDVLTYDSGAGKWGPATSGGSVTFADPSATASDTAVNGTATTAMRSDAAPAVQKCSSSQFGLCKVDNSSITASGGIISAAGFVPLAAAYHPGFVSGRYYSCPYFTASPSTTSFTSNTLYAIPFFVSSTTTFTKAGFRNSSGGAGNFEIGVYYNVGGTPGFGGQPGALKQDVGSNAVTNNAFNTVTSLTITLSPGWYWLAIAFSNTGQICYASSTTPLTHILGTTDPNTVAQGVTGAWTYNAGNLPNPFPSVTYSGTTSPIIVLGP